MNSPAMAQGNMQGQFMTQMQPNQIMASKLIGTRVVSSNNESIGDINDVVMDRNGQTIAAVVGVGGFLGIGEKDVAVPFTSLEFAGNQSAMNAGNNVTTTGSTATGTTGGSTGTMASNSSSGDNGPDRVVLRMTKAELQAAPSFSSSARNNTSGSTGATGTTTAPKQ